MVIYHRLAAGSLADTTGVPTCKSIDIKTRGDEQNVEIVEEIGDLKKKNWVANKRRRKTCLS